MSIQKLNKNTGWIDYSYDEYTSGSPLSLSADTDTILPNNSATIRDTYKPNNTTDFYTPATIEYDALTEDFVIGETVTGGTSGATANIVDVSKNGTAGVLFVDTVSGTFQNDETITGSGSGSATVNDTTFYGKILGKEGDAYAITVNLKAVPTNANTTYIEVWFDIGGAVGELYRRIVTFPKGQGVEREITFSTVVYTLDTWELNGAEVFVNSVNTADIYDIRFVVTKLHNA